MISASIPMYRRLGTACVAVVAIVAGLAGCAMTPEQRIAAEKRAIAAKPAPNRLYIPERQPAVGDRAVFETAPGALRHEFVVTGRVGDRYRIRMGWLATAPEDVFLQDLSIHYEVDGQGLVRAAVLEDRTQSGSQPLRLALIGEPGYVSQPTVLRLPVPETVDTGRRKLRIDAIALDEVRGDAGSRTEIRYLSDEVPLGVARTVSVPASVLSVTEVVALVGATRMAAGTARPAAAPPAGLDESLAPRLAAAAGRIVSRLFED
jgi:hypothetical protein